MTFTTGLIIGLVAGACVGLLGACLLFMGRANDDEPETRLRAAAPDMLAALKATVPILEAMQRIFVARGWADDHIAGGPLNAMIAAAITKAETGR